MSLTICLRRRNHRSLTAFTTITDISQGSLEVCFACCLLCCCTSAKPIGSQADRLGGTVWPGGMGSGWDQQVLPPYWVGWGCCHGAGDNRATRLAGLLHGKLAERWQSCSGWGRREGRWRFSALCWKRVLGVVCTAQPWPGLSTPVASHCSSLPFTKEIIHI